MIDEEKKSRTENASLNTVWAIISQMGIVLIGLLSRKVFLARLGEELLGVNSLFTDVLLLFSFADLGIGTAIMFSMYRPIAEGNEKAIKSLLLLYRTIYRYVIIVILVISLAYIPFLKYIKTELPFSKLLLYYVFFQANNVLEYLWAYREGYVIACQSERYISKWNLAYSIVKSICQILIVVFLNSFVAYLLIGILCGLTKKIMLNLYITKKYPITRLEDAEELSLDDKRVIVRKAYALLVTKIGNLIINQTDSLIVSYFISVARWGFASNYILIKKSVTAVSDKIYSSILPSVGNLLSCEAVDHKKVVFLKYDFLNAWMHTFFFAAFVSLSSPFISIIFGPRATLDSVFVFIFFLATFFDGLRSPVSVMREAGGAFEKDKWYTIIAAFVNIIVSIPLAIKWGISGVYVGTIAAMLVLHFFRTIILFRSEDYGISAGQYFGKLIEHLCVGVLVVGITLAFSYGIERLISSGIVIFVLKCLCAMFVSNAVWILLYFNNPLFKELLNDVVRIVRDRRGVTK